MAKVSPALSPTSTVCTSSQRVKSILPTDRPTVRERNGVQLILSGYGAVCAEGGVREGGREVGVREGWRDGGREGGREGGR